MAFRVIPRLDIKAPNLVKGIRLEGFRKLGSPEEFASRYFEQGADEILYQDIVASLYERNSLNDLIEASAKRIFVPLTVGGGIRKIEDIQNILRSGADKVCVNTAAIQRPEFITESAQVFGSQCVVVAIETILQSNGQWKAFTDCGREHTGVDAYDWAMRAIELGAGEIMLTSVDRDGTKKGFELDLIEKITKQSPVPVIAHGGAAEPEHVLALAQAGANGAVVAGMLHYEWSTIPEIKQTLMDQGIEVRI